MDPPDGGCKAWLVMLCSFVVNGVVFGIINTFGIIFVKLKDNLEAAGVDDAALQCSLVGSLAIGCTFFFSFLAGVLTEVHFRNRNSSTELKSLRKQFLEN